MEAPLKTDVLIVGAGPTGLSLAAQFIRYGIDFVIVDKKEGVTNLSKALAVHARTLEIYDQFGLAQKAVAEGEVTEKLALMNGGEVRAHIDLAAFGAGLSQFPFVLVLEQSKNEELLHDFLRQNNKDVQWQTELLSLTQDAGGIKADLQTTAGQTRTVEARYQVGCDGASNATRHQLGFGFEGSTHPRLFYVADVEAQFPADEATVYAAFGTDAFALLFPMHGQNHWRLVGSAPSHDEHGTDLTAEEALAKAEAVVQRPLNVSSVRWFSTYKVHTRYAHTFRQGRCFVAGDAAHVHTPAGGQGMNTGIQDAYNLAWKLALALQGRAGDALLDTYSQERLANAKRLLRTTDQLFEFAASDAWYQRLFRKDILPTLANFVSHSGAAKEFLFPTVSQIGIHYRESALSRHEGDHAFEVRAGDRMPYFRVDGANVYDRLHEPGFHLLAFSDGQSDYGDLRAEVEATHRDWLDFHVLPLLPRVVELFGTNRPFLALLRPDNHLAFLSPDFSPDTLRTYFDALTC